MSDYPFLVNLDPVAFELGPLKVHWYGIMYLLAFAAFWLLANYRAQRSDTPLNREQAGDFLFYGMLGVILGGRIGYMLFYASDQLLADPFSLFKIHTGGMSFHGGLIGVALATAFYARKVKCGFFQLTDFIIPMVPVGLMFGRIGNFIGGELWGRTSDVPWAMLFPGSVPGYIPGSEAFMAAYMAGELNEFARHPSQLYQAGLEGLLLFILIWWYSRQERPRMAVSGWFLIGYAVFRSFVEFYREPDAHLGFIASDWLTMGMVLCVPMFAFGLTLLVIAYSRKTHNLAH